MVSAPNFMGSSIGISNGEMFAVTLSSAAKTAILFLNFSAWTAEGRSAARAKPVKAIRFNIRPSSHIC